MIGWLHGTIGDRWQEGNRCWLLLICGPVGYELQVSESLWQGTALESPTTVLPNYFGATFSKTYVVNDANPSWTIKVELGSQWTETRTPTDDSKLLMKATKIC